MAGFAGSRYLDERRRRRLATESDEADRGAATSAPPITGGAAPSPRVARSSYTHFPLRKAISRRKWKVWSVGLISLLFGIGMLVAGIAAARQAERLGPGFVQIFDLSAARMVSLYATLQLMLTGQLAVFIWWGRSRSLNDFGGRYRVWAWTAAVCFLFTLLTGVEAHKAIVETVRWATGIESSARLAAAWLVPTLICLTICVLRLSHELRNNRVSVVLLWMAVAAWSVTAAQQLGSRLSDVAALGGETVVLAGCRIFAHWCSLMCLLWHARHVVYESAEAPAETPSRIKRLLSRLLIRLKRNRSADEDDVTAKSPKAVAPRQRSRKATTVAAPEQPDSAKMSVATKPAPAALPVATQPKPVPSPPNPIASPSPPEKSSGISRIDPPEGDDDEAAEGDAFRGLSKKERRQLRKQLRQQQRSGR